MCLSVLVAHMQWRVAILCACSVFVSNAIGLTYRNASEVKCISHNDHLTIQLPSLKLV